jgi:hypothetical protein
MRGREAFGIFMLGFTSIGQNISTQLKALR